MNKDLLIKLILTIEKNVKKSFDQKYEKVYKKNQAIYEGIAAVLPERLAPMVSRCAFPGCREVEVLNGKYGWAEEKMLNSCIYNCGSDIHYCDVHDKLDYVRQLPYDDVEPVCPECKLKRLEKGDVIDRKDSNYTEKGKKQLEEDIKADKEKNKRKQEREKRKIPDYYAMSKKELVDKIITIAKETKMKCERKHQKELKVNDEIMRKISDIVPDTFFPSVCMCEFKDCENFSVDNDRCDPYYFNDIQIISCDFCGNVYYCEEHLSSFSVITEDDEDQLYCCAECKADQ